MAIVNKTYSFLYDQLATLLFLFAKLQKNRIGVDDEDHDMGKFGRPGPHSLNPGPSSSTPHSPWQPLFNLESLTQSVSMSLKSQVQSLHRFGTIPGDQCR